MLLSLWKATAEVVSSVNEEGERLGTHNELFLVSEMRPSLPSIQEAFHHQ